MLSTLTECHPDGVTLKPVWHHSRYGNIFMTSLVKKNGRQCMSCFTIFSMTLQIEILSTGTSDFLEEMIILKSFNSMFHMDVTRERISLDI